jgi:hypothetical protein
MSIKEVDYAIRELQIRNTSIQSPQNCRYSVGKMIEIAKKADISPPNTIMRILVWPFASASEETHYALEVLDNQGKDVVYNPVRTGGFPLFNGDKENAPGLLRQMKVAEEIL